MITGQLQMGFMKNPHSAPIVGWLITPRHEVTVFSGDPLASSTVPDPQTRMYMAGKVKTSFLISSVIKLKNWVCTGFLGCPFLVATTVSILGSDKTFDFQDQLRLMAFGLHKTEGSIHSCGGRGTKALGSEFFA